MTHVVRDDGYDVFVPDPYNHGGDAEGFAHLAAKITRETSFRCASYKDKCLRRRIAVRMRARNAASYAEYATVLDSDPTEYEQLLDALTINVTKFFRNWPTFESIARNVIPALWAKAGPIRVWSAGSSSGEEAYSLATLFYQHALSLGQGYRITRVSVLGSDIDRASLSAAEHAAYPPTAFVETPDDMAERFFQPYDARGAGEGRQGAPVSGPDADLRTVVPVVRQLVRFERRDILREPPPPGIFELVVCRNVIIYFDRPAQEEVFAKFHHVLAPGGYLVLGRVETLLGQPRSWFTPVDLRERIFRKSE